MSIAFREPYLRVFVAAVRRLLGQASFGSIILPAYQTAACGGSSGPALFQQNFNLLQGEVITYGATVVAVAVAAATTPHFLSTAATADASHTLAFNLTPVTPGASYTTASGLNYVASVPDSSWTLTLFGFATTGIAVIRRRLGHS